MALFNKLFERDYTELLFTSILFLFFLQLFSDFIEFTYILCLMTLSLNENVLTVLFLFSSIFLLFFKKKLPDNILLVVGELMILCRIIEPLFDTQLRMIVSGLGVGCFLIFFPGYLLWKDSNDEEHDGIMLGLGLAIAIVVSVLFRTLNSSIDISTHGWFQTIGWVLAAIETIILFNLIMGKEYQQSKLNSQGVDTVSSSDLSDTIQSKSKRDIIGITIGLLSILFLVYFSFSSPVVISRWTEGNYFLITAIVVIMTLLFIFIMLYQPQLISQLKYWMVWVWNALFIITFVLTIFVNQISFPKTLDIYPIEAPLTTIIHFLPLIIMLFLFPIILIDFTLLSRELLKMKPKLTTRNLGISFTMGGLFMLLLIFALLFTSTWGFIPIIGIFFRDMFWLVFFIVGLFGVLSLKHVSKNTFQFKKSSFHYKTKIITAGMIIIFCMGTIIGLILLEAHPVTPEEEVTSLRFLTYNIQQGVDDKATKNYDGQLELIRQIDADIIGLQETSKIAGNSDPVSYFANKLNLYSYYGPKGVTGTTGVALLSKYPIRNPKTFYHFSENVDRKQTANIEAEITVQGNTFTVYVTHTFGRMSAKSILQQDVLTRAVGKSNVIFMGDFNFRPNDEPYILTTATLNESWVIAESSYVDDSSGKIFNVSRRIDMIFVSNGITVTQCQYITDPQSDHPAYWADIRL